MVRGKTINGVARGKQPGDQVPGSDLFAVGQEPPDPNEAGKVTPISEQPADQPSGTQLRRAPESQEEDRQEFFIPLHGFVWLYPEEVQVVDHPAFQRLALLYQLGQACLVFRGATHKRLEHVIGTVHVVERMADAVRHNAAKKRLVPRQATYVRGAPLAPYERRFLRLGALLHDIGHVANGHTVEDELGLLGKHDGDERLQALFEGSDWVDRDGRTLGALIDMLYEKYIPEDIPSAIRPSILSRLLIRRPGVPPKTKLVAEMDAVADTVRRSSSFRIDVCRDLIGNTICADLLDYLHRDWYHVGKWKHFDERILQYMEIMTPSENHAEHNESPPATQRDVFLISLGNRPKIRTDAISASLDLLESRYQLAEAVLFHRTKLCAAAMLERALGLLFGHETELGSETQKIRQKLEKLFLSAGDEGILIRCLALTQEKPREDDLGMSSDEDRVAAKGLLEGLERRHLFEEFDSFFYDDAQPPAIEGIQDLYGSSSPDGPANRARAVRILERDFGLPLGSLAFYCPDKKMNAKIPEVRIYVDGRVARLIDYETEHDHALTGLHLEAQRHRFHRLWRVHFFIDPKVKAAQAAVVPLLVTAARHLVLGVLPANLTSLEIAGALAAGLSRTRGSHVYGKDCQATALVGARADLRPMGTYPTGAPSIMSFLE